MPELPEVETIVRGLRGPLVGRTVTDAKTFSLKIRTPVPKTLAKALTGARIDVVERRAKYILISLDTGHTMVIHLGMTGSIRVGHPRAAFKPNRHDHLWFRLDDATEIVFSDPRRFGILDLIPTAQLAEWPPLKKLGPEPLDRAFTGAVLAGLLKGRKVAVKLALMNQDLVVGVGNIYASEALFLSGISPLKEARSVSAQKCETLCAAIKTVLKASIRAGGSSLRDYRHANGEVGFFQDRFSVYDREGKKCPGCTCDVDKTGGIKRVVQGGRSTFYCPRKQK